MLECLKVVWEKKKVGASMLSAFKHHHLFSLASLATAPKAITKKAN